MSTNKLPVEALLDFAESAAYKDNDRLNITSIMQIFARMQTQQPNPGAPTKVHESTSEKARRLAQVLYLQAMQNPMQTQFTRTWLTQTHNEIHPDNPLTLRSLESPLNHLRDQGLVTVAPSNGNAKTVRILQIVSAPLLMQFIIPTSEEHPPTNTKTFIWPLIRHHLHVLAGQLANDNRDYDAMLVMATAFILRDPSKPNPAPTPLLPLFNPLLEDEKSQQIT